MQYLLAVPLLVVLALPVFWNWRLVALYLRAARRQPTEEFSWPRAAVVLSLRGADPFLTDCVAGLLDQDYPNYEIIIVIDSREDPAWAAVQRVLDISGKQRTPVTMRAVESRRESCSLKVSAQLEALQGLAAEVEVVAFIDADVLPSRTWLRALVRPLLDPRVGAATGFRWYVPRSLSWGSLVRYFWNTAAVAQMYSFQIPWGGSLALHARVFRHPDLLNQWQDSFGEDTRTYAVLRKVGQELRFVCEATAINTETIGLAGCCTFIRRQLFSARVSHSLWTSVLSANVTIGLALLGCLALFLLALISQDLALSVATGGALGSCFLGMLTGLLVGERALRTVVRNQGSVTPTHRLSWKHAPAVLLTLLVHFGCMFSALRLRHIDWRGVTYSLDKFGKLRLLEYRPYGPPAIPSQQGVSVL